MSLMPEDIVEEFNGLGISNQRRFMWELADLAEEETQHFYDNPHTDKEEVFYAGDILEALEKSPDIETVNERLESIAERLDEDEEEGLRELTDELAYEAYQSLDIEEYEEVLGKIEALDRPEEFFDSLQTQVSHYVTDGLDQDYQRIKDLTRTFIQASSSAEEFTGHVRGLHSSYVVAEEHGRADKLEEFVEKLYSRALPAELEY